VTGRRLLLVATALLAVLLVAPAIANADCNGLPATVAGATAGPDTLNGTSGDDVIEGLGGNDTINGGGGNDTICGDADNDTVNGGTGNDHLEGGETGTDVDTVTFLGSEVGSTGVTASLQTGTATVFMSETNTLTGFENLTGSNGFDNLTGDDGPNAMDGLDRADNLTGLGGDDVITDPAGGTGDTDELHYENSPGPGGIVADLSAGTVDGTAAGAGTDTVSGVFGVDGTSFDDVIAGDANHNSLVGGSGNDLLAALGGSDNVIGQDGTDTVNYATETGPIVADLSSFNSNNVTAPGGNDSVFGVENMIGSPQDDQITGGPENNSFDGRGGADQLNGGTGGSDTAGFNGIATGVTADLGAGTATGQGSDTLTNIDNLLGSTQADTLTGDDQDNMINGLQGADSLDGGTGGVDTASFAGLAQGVDANLATDSATTIGPGEIDTLANFDNLSGTNHDDFLTGDGGPNVFDGGLGGIDTVRFSGVSQGVTASLVSNTATGQGSDSFSGIENLTGSDQADTLTGDDAPNALTGLAGADNLTGGLGADGFFLGDGLDVITADDGVVDVIDCEGSGPDSGSVDGPAPDENYITPCDTDGDALIDFFDACPTQSATTSNGCPGVTPPVVTPTPPAQAQTPAPAAKKKCKKKKKKQASVAKKKCKKKKRG
jgi:Ca2+-binding RTX toxin-like protein